MTALRFEVFVRAAAIAALTATIFARGFRQTVPTGSFGVRYRMGVIADMPVPPGVTYGDFFTRTVTAESSDNLDSLVACDPKEGYNCVTTDGMYREPFQALYWNHVNETALAKRPCLNATECPLLRAWLAYPVKGEVSRHRFGSPAVTNWSYEPIVYVPALKAAFQCVITNNPSFALESDPFGATELVAEVARAHIRFSEVFVLDRLETVYFRWPGVYYNSVARANRSLWTPPANKIIHECSLEHRQHRINRRRAAEERQLAAGSAEAAQLAFRS